MSGLRTVLVVDDDRVNRLVLRRVVQAAGLGVAEASDGAEGARAAVLGTHALVLMDIMMPVLDGYEAIRRIRLLERGSGRSTPIIAVTALTDAATRSACIAAGADFYVPKPIDMDRMLAAIGTYALAAATGTIAAPIPGALEGPGGNQDLTATADILDILDLLTSRHPGARGDLRGRLVALGASRALGLLDNPAATPEALAAEVRTAVLVATTPCPR